MTKVSQFTEITSLADNDLIPVIDTSEGLQKRITKVNLATQIAGSVTLHEATYDHTKIHDRNHAITNPTDHTGIAGATEDNFLSADANGLPKDSGHKDSDYADATHSHVESDITDLDHNAAKIDSLPVDLTGMTPGQAIVLNGTSDGLEAGAPSAEVTIPGGTENNFVSIAADETLKDSGSAAGTFATSGHDHDLVYAPIGTGVTGGDAHDHSGGDGAQIDHAGLANLTAGDPHTQYLKIITADTTLYVATTGDDVTGDGSIGTPWATPQKALEYLNDYWISPAAYVDIMCGDGSFALTTAITVKHACGDRIRIRGTNTYAKTMSSVQSSSGGAGAWSVVINLNNVTNIASGDFVIISAPSGGTKPTYIAGCHPVTNVDAVNSRITITSGHQNATAPSGNVAATVTVIKTVFANATTNIVYMTDGTKLGGIGDLVLDGLGNANIGLYVTGASLCKFYGSFGIYAPDGGIFADDHGLIWAPDGVLVAVSDTPGNCYQADDHSAIIIDSGPIASGAYDGGYGFFATYCSHIECSDGLSTGGASIGLIITTNASCRAGSIVVTAHTTGIYAGRHGYIYAVGSSIADCSTTYNPTVNTSGNEGGYIDT